MKNTSIVIMAVMTVIVFAASATFTGCSKGNAIGDEAIWQSNVSERHIGPVDGSYANGVVMFRCIDSFWVDYMGQTYPSTHFCNSQYRLEGDNAAEIAALSGCYAVDTTTTPYHILGTSLTLTFVRDEVEEALVTLVGNTDPTDFRSRFATCHIGIVGVCVNPEEHNIVFKGLDENGDTAFARGRWYGTIHDTTIVVEHDTIHHYDTTIVTHTDTVFLHDTIRVIQIDTVFGLDTVFLHDTIVRIDTVWWEDSTVVDLIHNSWNTPVLTSDSLKFSCGNQQITKRYRNGVLLSQTPENFNGYFSRKYSAEGSIRPEQIGMKLPFTGGQADFGNGLKLRLIGPQAKYTIPFSYRPQLIQLGCSHTDDSVEVVNGGLLYIGYDRCGSEIVRRTVLITRPNADTTTRRIVGRDTVWNGCGQVYQTWLSASATVLSYYISRTGVETVTYNVGSPLTVTNTVRDTTVYTYTITVNGQGHPADVNTTANFSGNTVTFGGLSVTLTPYGSQNWCTLTHTTGTLTSTGVNVTGVYNGSSRQTLIPVTFVNPPLFSEEVIMAVASDGYKAATPNVLSGDRVTSLIVIVAKHVGSSTTYWFYHGDWNTFATRADLDSVQITATEATYYSSQLLNDYYPAIVFNHNNPTQFKRGVVKSTYLSASSCWQLIYKIAEPGANHDQVAYTMSASAWTIVGDGGRNALRGVMTSTGSLTADGVTKQIY